MELFVHQSCAFVGRSASLQSTIFSREASVFKRAFLVFKDQTVKRQFTSRPGNFSRSCGFFKANQQIAQQSISSEAPKRCLSHSSNSGGSLFSKESLQSLSICSTAARSFHSSSVLSSPEVSSVRVNESSKCIEVCTGTEVLRIPFVWLRDHCRSDRYYNSATNQKNADADLLQRNLIPDSVSLTEGNSGFYITWKDGHRSEFTAAWLQQNFYPGQVSQVAKRHLWDRAIVKSRLPCVPYVEHMHTEDGLKKTLSSLVTYGFCLVEGAPASIQGTQSVVERVTFVLQTLFGGMWSFTSNAARSDTAYSVQALGAHTDMTYMDTPAGIQVFQCLKHTGTGGETLLVDGFRAIEQLREQSPQAFELLNKTVIPHEYVEEPGENSPGYHLYSLGPVIRLHPASKEAIQLRFNPYDRAPLNTVAPELMDQFYQAYDQLSRIIASEEGELWIKLTPGTVLLVDNWRVMHGRSAFDGERFMCGCYLPREEWVSKARVLGVL